MPVAERSTDQLPFMGGDSTKSRGPVSPLEIRSFTTPSWNPLQPATRCGHLPENLFPGGSPGCKRCPEACASTALVLSGSAADLGGEAGSTDVRSLGPDPFAQQTLPGMHLSGPFHRSIDQRVPLQHPAASKPCLQSKRVLDGSKMELLKVRTRGIGALEGIL